MTLVSLTIFSFFLRSLSLFLYAGTSSPVSLRPGTRFLIPVGSLWSFPLPSYEEISKVFLVSGRLSSYNRTILSKVWRLGVLFIKHNKGRCFKHHQQYCRYPLSVSLVKSFDPMTRLHLLRDSLPTVHQSHPETPGTLFHRVGGITADTTTGDNPTSHRPDRSLPNTNCRR